MTVDQISASLKRIVLHPEGDGVETNMVGKNYSDELPSSKEMKLGEAEEMPNGYYRRILEIPVKGELGKIFKTVRVPVYAAEKDFDFEEWYKDEEIQKYLLCSGLSSTPDQFNRTETSMMAGLEKRLGKSLFFGLSTPGFTFSEFKDGVNPGVDDVSAKTYAQLIDYVVSSLRLPMDTVLIGHSAGGAAVMEYLSQALQGKLKYEINRSRVRKVIALDPAINVRNAEQFKAIELALQAKKLIEPIPEINYFLMQKTVMILLGFGMANYQDLPTPKKEQVDLHVYEMVEHPEVMIAKLQELRLVQERQEHTRRHCVVITGGADRITFFKDINDKYGGVCKVEEANHDDMFIIQKIQDKYLDLMVPYIQRGAMPLAWAG